MDPVSLVSGLIAAQVGEAQLAVAARLARSGGSDPMLQSGADVSTLIEAAQQNFNALANVAAGIGGALDIRA
jgi:hypothetical protein